MPAPTCIPHQNLVKGGNVQWQEFFKEGDLEGDPSTLINILLSLECTFMGTRIPAGVIYTVGDRMCSEDVSTDLLRWYNIVWVSAVGLQTKASGSASGSASLIISHAADEACGGANRKLGISMPPQELIWSLGSVKWEGGFMPLCCGVGRWRSQSQPSSSAAV